jgi:hypothetical protein
MAITDKSLGELESHQKLSILLVMLLEFFQAGGLSETEAKDIYDTLMHCTGNLKDPAHHILIQDIIEKWALPQIKTEGNA